MNPSTVSIPLLETERLQLRPFHHDDLSAYAEMMSDHEVIRYTFHPRPMDREQAWRDMALHLGHWLLRGYGMWAIEERASGSLVGRTGLFEPEEARWTDLSWMLVRSAWSQGYGTEAVQAVIKWTFAHTQIQRLACLVDAENARSLRTAQRLGLSQESEHAIFDRKWLLFSARAPTAEQGASA